jgi:hypothetical protein
METVDAVRASFTKRIGTGELNRFFAEVLELRPPPTMGAKAPRLYYVTQAEHSPPKFVVITNAPDSVHFSYQRFVINQLRKRFGFEGVPIRVFYKAKRRTERAERMIARADATAEHKPRQKVDATTRARAKARRTGAEPTKATRPRTEPGKSTRTASRPAKGKPVGRTPRHANKHAEKDVVTGPRGTDADNATRRRREAAGKRGGRSGR